MQITSQKSEKLLCGNQSFSQLGFSMMVTRLRGAYAKDPSQAIVQKATNEINTFLTKFESIMANDYAIIQKL